MLGSFLPVSSFMRNCLNVFWRSILTRSIKVCNLFLFFLKYWGFELRAYMLTHSTSPFFVMGFFWGRILWTVCIGWLCTLILLISIFWIARIIGVNHRDPALYLLLNTYFLFFFFVIAINQCELVQFCFAFL
jgi:hypothetical protein